MATSKKPRKAYRPKPVIKPLNIRDAWGIEGEAHAVLLAIESESVSEDHLAMLAAHADMVRRIYPIGTERIQADAIFRVVAEIKSRPEIRVLSLEEVAIRAAMSITIEAMRKARNADIYKAAMSAIQDMERNGGAVSVVL